jgi:glycosyltransferase involved in cell wall biosynthesis
MRLLFVVQRYGVEVAGGAEQACRAFAERLAAEGHDVHVVTSCARSYVDWADEFAPGPTEIRGVQVHRLPVVAPRHDAQFGFLNHTVNKYAALTAPLLQRSWMQEQGPRLQGFEPWLVQHAADFDVMVCFTYLYWTTWTAVRVAAPLVPTVLHPTAHQEPYLALPLFDEVFRRPDALALFTPEEGALIKRRFRTPVLSEEIGIGLGPPPEPLPEGEFRHRVGIGDRPFVLFLGRVDPGKGSDEVVRYFEEYRRRRPERDLALVVVGDPVTRPGESDDVVLTGYVDEATKAGALAHATALLQPSYFESFSLALVEAWQHRTPALVQGYTDVLVGQARRSGGAIPYRGYPAFEVGLDRLLDDEALRAALGQRGHDYVERRYRWPVVLDKYGDLLERVARRRRTRSAVRGPHDPRSSRSSSTSRNSSASSA